MDFILPNRAKGVTEMKTNYEREAFSLATRTESATYSPKYLFRRNRWSEHVGARTHDLEERENSMGVRPRNQ